MKVVLAFDDWIDEKSVYSREDCASLSTGVFHHGTIFRGFSEHEAREMKRALERGFCPVFRVIEVTDE